MNLYKYAQETERSGIDFYRKMADQATEEGISRVFGMMAADEEKLMEKLEGFQRHYPEFRKMRCDSLSKKAIAFNTICDNGYCDRISSDLDAYQLAINAKGKVVEQYLKAAETENDPRIKQMLQWLAALEKQELHQIEQLFDFANAPNHSLEWGEFSNLDEFHNFGYYEDLRRGNLDS